LIEHLKKICQEESYQPSKLQELSNEISTYMEEKIRKREELIEKEQQKERLKELKRKELEERKKAKERVKAKVVNKQFATIEELEKLSWEDLQANGFNEQTITTPFVAPQTKLTKQEIEQLQRDWKKEQARRIKIFLKSQITNLAREVKELEETKQLIEGIQTADKAIRQRVFSHIFNNLTDISQVTGGEDFINNIVENKVDFAKISKLSIAELQVQREKLEAKLLEKEDVNQSLEVIKDELAPKEQALLNLKKQLLSDEEILAKWQEQGFNLAQAQEWANVLESSFNPENDASFCAWLRDNKEIKSEEIVNHDIKELQKEYYDKLEKEVDTFALSPLIRINTLLPGEDIDDEYWKRNDRVNLLHYGYKNKEDKWETFAWMEIPPKN